MSFTHLQVRSGYSLMKSTIIIDRLVKKAKELGFDSLALTDEHVLYGAIPFYKACLQAGMKPIIGMTTFVEDEEENMIPCTLLAKNNHGYQSLIRLSTFIQFHDKTSIHLMDFKDYIDQLICILPAGPGKIRTLFTDATFEHTHAYLSGWQDLFAEGDVYLGMEPETDPHFYTTVKAFSDQYSFPAVAINDVRYLNEKTVIAYDCLQAMKDGRKWAMKITDPSHYGKHLRPAPEMETIFSQWPEVITETEEIASKCQVTIDFESRFIPSFPVPGQMDAHTYLKQICWENVKKKYSTVTKEIADRLTYELNIIRSMKFSDYFLIVSDFISYAKENNILVGPGRGSSAGSIVAYCLGITDVDPIKYNLLFERFLNPERQTMPDIDVDFSDSRRDEVIDYVRGKYGEDHVAQIVTFGTFAQRSLIRELIKTMDVNQEEAQFLLRKIPIQSNKSLDELLQQSEELKQYVKGSQKLKLLMAVALQLEGIPRHISTHAAGVVITEKPLTDHVPLTVGANDIHLTQFAMNDLESIGLLKMDFLGLRNLTLLERIIQSIHYTTKKKIQLNQIPGHDEKAYQLLREGRTNGVFQLESQGMKRVLTELQPNSFEDIVAVNALFRPGPMDFIPVYIARKHKQEEVTYPHPDLAPILERTYGVLIYQEQIMQIASQIAGFTLGEADILRRAVSKKKQDVMEQQKEAFIAGCLKNGYERSVAEEIFSWIVRFSNYGFPRSHAVAYSMISYQLSFLKANYPANFFAELLSSQASQQDKVNQYIKEVKELHIDVLPPSINKSFGKYTVEKNHIRMGLSQIKGIGHQSIKTIIQERKNGPFKNLFDFCLRVSSKTVNRTTIENLIMAGCFDETFVNRASLLGSIDQAMEQGELFGGVNDQESLFGGQIDFVEQYAQMEDFSIVKKLADEKELLGMYISSHPLKEYRKKLRASGYIPVNHTKNVVGKRNIKLAVIIQSIRTIRTKRGESMAFLTVGDETGELDTVVFPDLYRNTNRWLKEEMMVFVKGKIDIRKNRLQMVMDEVTPFDESELQQVESQRLFVKLTEETSEQALSKLKETAQQFPGQVPIILYHDTQRKTYQLHEVYSIYPTSECMYLLRDYFGKQNIVLKK